MKVWFLVITSAEEGLRVYPAHAANAHDALHQAKETDARDYPGNPSPFNAIEVIQAERSALSI